MNGYVKNISPMWIHAMKRAIRPGGQISLDELYTEYGEKHSIPEGQEFADWLREVKLRDTDRWEILYQEDIVAELIDEEETVASDKVVEKKPKEQTKVPKHMSVSDVVELSVRNAKDVLPRIVDLKLLKYSVKEASTMTGKDSLCRLLNARIRKLEIAKAG